MDIWNRRIEEIKEVSSIKEYHQAVEALTLCLYEQGKTEEADYIKKFLQVPQNRFSAREEKDMMEKRREELLRYCAKLSTSSNISEENLIRLILENFYLFCKKLYLSDIHSKCSGEVKEHLRGFCIENEYDLQKLMLPALISVFSDARPEAVQDSGHHAVRKDIVIDSCDAVVELKCTRTSMTERGLSEEIASDLIHYECKNLFFYIYDKAGIIKSPVNFQKTYEERSVDHKNIHVVIYSHGDI